jgi:T5SS/PEP-CTERM-associated repeat protein
MLPLAQSERISKNRFAIMPADLPYYVGSQGTGTLAVTSDEVLVVSGLSELGADIGSNWTAVVSGAGSAWETGTSLLIGGAGTGSATVTTSATITAIDLAVGYLAGSSGFLSLSGAGSVADISQATNIGVGGTGSLLIASGATLISGASGELGINAGAVGSGTIEGSHAAWIDDGALWIGGSGIGALLVENTGSLRTGDLALGVAAGSAGTLTVTGAGLVVGGMVYLGYAGSGTLAIGAGVSATVAGPLQIASLEGAMGSLSVSGPGALLTVAQEFDDGAGGSGILTVSNQGTLALAADLLVGVNYGGSSAKGALTISSDGLLTAVVAAIAYSTGSKSSVSVIGTGSELSVTQAIYIGGNWAGLGGTGLLSITAEGAVTTPFVTIWNGSTLSMNEGTLLTASVLNDGTVIGNGAIVPASTSTGSQFVNNGWVDASGGILRIVGSLAGTGDLAIATGSELLLEGSVASSQAIDFAAGGAASTLALGTPWQMAATVSGFAGNDAVELVGVTGTTLEFSDGVLTAIGPAGPDGSLRAVASIRLSGTYSAGSFTLTQDGKGDSFITAIPSAKTISPAGSSESTYLETHAFFAANSPWNTRIGNGETYVAVPGLSFVLAGLSSWSGGSVAIYYAQTTDPLVPILYNPNTWYEIASGGWKQSGNSASIEEQILATSQSTNPIPGNPYSTQVSGLTWNSIPSGLPSSYDSWEQVAGQTLYAYVPAGAIPPAGADGQTAIIQPNGTVIELYAPIILSSGTWVSSMFSVTNAATDAGVGADNGRRASMVENYAGALRDIDVSSGTIDHALAITIPGSMLAQAISGPALAFDSNSSDYSGTLPMGAHLALPANLGLANLGLMTSFGTEMAIAAEDYGMYVVDRGGSGISVLVQNAPTSSALANWSSAEQHDLNAIVQHAYLAT